MKILDALTTLKPGAKSIRSEIRMKLLIFYFIGGSVALVTNLFMSPGLDFNPEQLRVVMTTFFPVSVVLCILADIPLVLFFARPIDRFLQHLEKNEKADKQLADAAFSRAINLPVISVLRVEFIHVPIGVISNLVPIFIVDYYNVIEFSANHYLAIITLAIMNGTIHSIVEYYLVSRLMKSTIKAMHGNYAYFALEDSEIIFINAKTKFYFIYFLIAVLPLIFLSSTMMFKARAFFFDQGLSDHGLLGELTLWTIIFIFVSSATSFLMAYILSREIIDPVKELMDSMKEVEKGKFEHRLVVTTADEFSSLYDGFNHMTEGLGEREMIKKKFGKYVSDKLLGDILEKDTVLGGDEKTVTILFSDIRNYTAMSETMSPAQTVEMLNEYFSAMVAIIEEHNGLLDKFIGDAVMAIFGAPVDDPDHAANALSAAIAMANQLEAFNMVRGEKGFPPIDIGIGISTGKVLVGNIGSDTRMEYTVIGDAVNLASRIESLTKETGLRILFSDSTYNMVKDKFTTTHTGCFDIKGKRDKCDVYSVGK